MAIIATAEVLGKPETLYIRLNNFEQLANHGIPAIARFRGYASREDFDTGLPFRFEQEVDFTPSIAEPLWPQAYAALKGMEAFAEARDA